MAGESPRHRRSIRNFLLDRRFQLKYTLFIVLAGGLIFGTMEAFFYEEVRANSELAVLSPDAEFAADLRAQLEAEDREVLMMLAAFWLALVALLFVVGIVATHRIVGPIHVVDRYVRRIRDGEPVEPRPLRRGDEFQTLYRHVNEMAAALRAERAAELEAVQRVLERIAVRLETLRERGETALAAGIEEDLTPLRDLLERKRTYVAGGDAGARETR